MFAQNFTAKMLFLFGGFVVWFAHFAAVYGFNGLACARGFAENTVLGFGVVQTTVFAATVLAVGINLMMLIAVALRRGPGVIGESEPLADFWRLLAGGGAALSIVAVLWTGLPALVIAPCA